MELIGRNDSEFTYTEGCHCIADADPGAARGFDSPSAFLFRPVYHAERAAGLFRAGFPGNYKPDTASADGL